MNIDALAVITGLAEDFRNGLVTEADYIESAERQLSRAFNDFTKTNFGRPGWHREFEPVFEEGYNAWLRGEKTEKFGDGNSFFELIKELGIPCEHYRCVPENIKFPTMSESGYKDGGEKSVIWYIFWKTVEDGGLFTDKDPDGKEFVLTNTDGLKAKLKVLSTKPCTEWDRLDPEDRTKFFSGKEILENVKRGTMYVCTGSIEEYTSGESTKIFAFNIEKDNLNELVIYPSDEDIKAIRSNPLWTEYYEWFDAKQKQRREYLMAFADRK